MSTITVKELDDMRLDSHRCAADFDQFVPLNWHCWKESTLLGQIGNEKFFACSACEGVFRTGAS